MVMFKVVALVWWFLKSGYSNTKAWNYWHSWIFFHGTSPYVSESETVLDSGFHAVDSWFQVLDSGLCHWNLDSGFQRLVGFRIPWGVFRIQSLAFRIPKPSIPDSTSKCFPDSGIRFPSLQAPRHFLYTRLPAEPLFLLLDFGLLVRYPAWLE